jgi:hypothetical protein
MDSHRILARSAVHSTVAFVTQEEYCYRNTISTPTNTDSLKKENITFLLILGSLNRI